MSQAAPVRDEAAQGQYRPVSGLAIASAMAALASPLIFMVDLPWMILILVVPAFFLALAARRRVRRSEGTLAGFHLAGFALAVSLVVGLSYATHHFTAYAIIRTESREFIEQWFGKLRTGKEGAAFLDCVAADIRKISFSPSDLARLRAHLPNPANPNDNQFDAWRRMLLPNMMIRYRDRVEWEHLAVDDWKVSGSNYTVKHRFRLRSPEFTAEMLISAASQITESESGQRREWRVDSGTAAFESGTETYTDYGADLRDAQVEATRAMRSWLKNLIAGKSAEVQAALLHPDDKDLQASVAQLAERVTRNVSTDTRGTMALNQHHLVDDVREGSTWLLEFHGVLDAGTREVELRVRLRCDDIKQGPAGWRIAAAKFQGERKKYASDASDLAASGAKGIRASPGAGHPGLSK